MKTFSQVQEAAYVGNLGFSEMVAFYKKASKDEEKQMDAAVIISRALSLILSKGSNFLI